MYIIRVAPVYSGWWVTIHLQIWDAHPSMKKKVKQCKTVWNNVKQLDSDEVRKLEHQKSRGKMFNSSYDISSTPPVTLAETPL
jgi:hypothetical protein